MRDITITEVERLQPRAGEAVETLQMDQDTFRAFYERTSRSLWVYLWRRTGDTSLADDLLQESYYRFLRAAVTFSNDSHRRHYLFRIATNLIHDTHRKRVDLVEVPEDDDRGALKLDVNEADRNQRRTDLARAMAQLNPRQRDALWLAYAEGSSHEEIAEALGMKVGSIKLVLYRARRKLAKLLSGADRAPGRRTEETQ